MTENDYRPVAAQPAQMSTRDLLAKLTPEIARALPKGMDAERMARLVMTEIRKSQLSPGPSLADCTRDSFAGALLTASALGLEPGVNGECYLIPYRDNKRRAVECQLVIGYQGVVKLFWQHPRAEFIDAQWVGANDTFHYVKGLNPVLEHIHAQGDRGEPVYYYAIAKARDAQAIWDVFTPVEIARLRRGVVGPKGDIPDPQRWMERKTALRQVLKLAPKSTRLDVAVRVDEQLGSQLYRDMSVELPAAATDFIEGSCDEQTTSEDDALDDARDAEDGA